VEESEFVTVLAVPAQSCIASSGTAIASINPNTVNTCVRERRSTSSILFGLRLSDRKAAAHPAFQRKPHPILTQHIFLLS
jgi:hypothetical protein